MYVLHAIVIVINVYLQQILIANLVNPPICSVEINANLLASLDMV